ncbi:hypothetical protein [[Erwinia] mediterraneensis]|uniref:hypothetical protein n=1 Tax=[Erwinia] mediterraneensis TaxID=2161819 RepID=UPI0010306563|nr:hypothetical protein [[Erwinia] mediterraneensis]
MNKLLMWAGLPKIKQRYYAFLKRNVAFVIDDGIFCQESATPAPEWRNVPCQGAVPAGEK